MQKCAMPLFIAFCISFSSFSQTYKPPAWVVQGNVYEVNVRQYTPEGTFRAFEQHLVRLKNMGVQTLWFMPIQPISLKDRKGLLGSYYAVANYREINPEFGTMNDWKHLIHSCHEMGFKVIIDWVANHTGADHVWLTTHPDFYVTDSLGKPVSQFDWTDTRKLNYNNKELADSMIASMKYWLKEGEVDGFRCDFAIGPPPGFWKQCIDALRQEKNDLFMLAEADTASLHQVGFDATYTWSEFNVMKQIAKQLLPVYALDSVLQYVEKSYPPQAIKLYFTSNHDENSWNGADYATMPGTIHAPFAVLTQTLPRALPLIYSGQEEPVLDSISFFYKDTIVFKNYARATFYSTLLHLRSNNKALSAYASFKKLAPEKDSALYAFMRENNQQKVFVVINASNKARTFSWTEQTSLLLKKKFYVMGATLHNTKNKRSFELPAWGYAVYAQ